MPRPEPNNCSVSAGIGSLTAWYSVCFLNGSHSLFLTKKEKEEKQANGDFV